MPSKAEAHQRKNAPGVPAFAKATARPPNLATVPRERRRGPGASEKKAAANCHASYGRSGRSALR